MCKCSIFLTKISRFKYFYLKKQNEIKESNICFEKLFSFNKRIIKHGFIRCFIISKL